MNVFRGDPKQPLTPPPAPCRQLDLFGIAADRPRGSIAPEEHPLLHGTAPEFLALAEAFSRTPQAVACMLTAARLQGLLPDAPDRVWLGAPLRVYVPKTGPAPARVLRWSNAQAFHAGVQRVVLHDVTILLTGPARTVVDLVRYRRHVGGVEAASQCLRTFSRAGGTPTDLRSAAAAVGMPQRAQDALDLLILGAGLTRS